MRYFNIEIDFTEEHMAQIATAALHLLKENLPEDEFEYFVKENDISEEQMKFFGLMETNRCPCCNGKLEQETYYDSINEDTSYYSYCTSCGWDDRPDEDFDDSEAWEDDSNRGCKDCPPDECTGHCMSCYYRPV